ncbi:MAG: RluA family pseudouridine synthase [Deltaproteobacteria bacterium]|nr:RluA family pseudouridine synthase [Deltaproteobacteria bacterium]
MSHSPDNRSAHDSGPDPGDQDRGEALEAGNTELRFDVDSECAGQRLDVFFSERSGVSRSQIRRWIADGIVLLNADVVRPSRKVSEGDVAVARVPAAEPMDVLPEAIPLVVLYEDEDLIVIDKAAGMVVHPAPGHPRGTLVNALLHHCDDLAGVGGVLRPGIVHRLDRGTSGVMVVAKNDAAHRHLAKQFHDHTIDRTYWAFVRSIPGAESGEVDGPIGRHPRDRKRMSIRSDSGRAALTRWRIVIRYPASGISRLEIRPETGRTHQIRVHLSSVGMPIVGDPVYGRQRDKKRGQGFRIELERPALHAARLGFSHPRSGDRLDFEAPLPEDLAALLQQLEAFEGGREKR